MKNYYLTIFLILMTSGIFAQYDSIPYDGDYRTYLLHLPSGYTGISDLPLIVAMHGGFGNAYNMETISELSIKADAEHFIVVYPEGVKGGFLNASSWNAGWCCGFASSSNVDDVGFIDSLLNTLIGDYSIDTNRIYATGMSNGGFMSYRLACELSDRIAAIAPVECSMTMTSCTPNRVVPIIHFHSYLDTHIPYDGGIGSGPSNHYNPPIDSVLNVWASNNSCGILNDTIINNAQYTLTKWTDCDCETEIHCYITQDGGHSWPGVGGSAYINATDLMWTFFQQYSLDCNPTFIANENRQESKIKIYPNPTNNIIKIQPYINWKNIKISVFSPQGQEILRSIDQTEVDISNLSNGLLLMKIELDDTVEMHIILKTK
jgi:polyhydroxybutyrate depolymerase|tara:strand:- start:98 stop:1222 length:1125 start_codon:yes stop_codon:yes gene_type:complete